MPFTFRAPPRIDAPELGRILTRYNSPVAPLAVECFDIITNALLDPALAMAIFGHESVFGTLGTATTTLNWGNVRTPFNPLRAIGTHPAGFVIFPSWQVGLQDWCERINERYLKQRNLHTPEEVIPVYAPSSDGNNVQQYLDHVNRLVNVWMAEMQGTLPPTANRGATQAGRADRV